MKITNAYLDEKRHECDVLADEVVTQLFTENQFYAFNELLRGTTKNHALQLASLPHYVQNYFAQTSILPTWADADLMKKGSLFFDKHSENIILMLSFLSLPYCYANAKGAKVLTASQRIGNQTKKRLYETAQYIFDVSTGNAFSPKGAGFISVQKVRLMHATIRYYIRKSGTWDISAFGEPINQEDLAMTHLSFCFVVLQGLRKIGIGIGKEDAEAYLHLWKVISYLVGVDVNLLADTELAAYRLDQLIQQRHFEKSEDGVSLTHALFSFLEKSIEETPNQNPILAAKGFVPSYARFVMGEKLADLLAVPSANWTGNLLGVFKLSNAFKNVFSFEQVNAENGKLLLRTIQKSEGKADFALPQSL